MVGKAVKNLVNLMLSAQRTILPIGKQSLLLLKNGMVEKANDIIKQKTIKKKQPILLYL